MKIHLIVNPPSCGSTLLGELLDCTGFSVGGPAIITQLEHPLLLRTNEFYYMLNGNSINNTKHFLTA